MDWSHGLLFAALLITAAAIHGAQAYAMVSGAVFCDQCKDGQISLFDYPIYGMKVRVTCADSNGQTTMSREETTNLFGNYVMRFDGTPNLSNCFAQVSSGSEQGSTGCGAAAGPAQNLRLMFSVFDMEIYFVDSLLTQPAQPMSFCPKSANPVSPPATPTTPPAPVTPSTPPAPVTPSTPPAPVTRPICPPPFRLPPMPRFPPLPPLPRFPPLPPLPRFPPLPPLPHLPPMPPMPFVEATACPHQSWAMPEYKCYWRALNQDTKVAVAFGPLGARRYGTDVTLWQGLQGRGDLYRTLLREATTALLNSYNSLQFPYNSVSVVTHMNYALMGSPRSALLTAFRFMRANSGSGNVTCKFTPCK
ncbi:pollen ole e 1 allergen and extensin family protein [Citrus sinensis]|uniref:Wall-associated receptor kinase galacturonan-binding domain-containing protein n=1 Tax=Citrus clementina TaxID=85681 RepID=V4UC41_CITCL|nr:protodermal factor 1 [Citrus x clementina]XP_006487426.2 protodermal factor 1 [Citrus sinensis]ESR36854.1 hypothetical protein CICLE_v10028711mg [Citrus x clementina]KAH9657392.1 pollen ole e 1 allergen and extensin family protein [Citrus sinensis]